MAALGIIGIIVGVAVLIYGAYKGISTIILAPLCALLIALFNGMNLLTTFTDTMLPSVCNYVTGNAWTSIDGMCYRCIVQCKWCCIVHRKRIV